MKSQRYALKEPSWDVFENDFLVTRIRSLSPSKERSHLIQKWRQREKGNQEIKDEGVFSAEIQVRPDNDHFYIRPSRKFYEEHPVCKFSSSEWQDKDNDFDTTDEAIISITQKVKLPNILSIQKGYGLKAPHRIVERCNNHWHSMITDEIRAEVMRELASQEDFVIVISDGGEDS